MPENNNINKSHRFFLLFSHSLLPLLLCIVYLRTTEMRVWKTRQDTSVQSEIESERVGNTKVSCRKHNCHSTFMFDILLLNSRIFCFVVVFTCAYTAFSKVVLIKFETFWSLTDFSAIFMYENFAIFFSSGYFLQAVSCVTFSVFLAKGYNLNFDFSFIEERF